MSVAQERNLRLVRDVPSEPGIRLGDIRLRNRLVTSSSLPMTAAEMKLSTTLSASSVSSPRMSSSRAAEARRARSAF